MGQNNIQFCLVPAKGISTTDVLTVKLRSTRKQLKTQTPHFAFHGESGSAPVKSQGVIMEPTVAAQIQAEKTNSDFIAWSKTAFYWI